MIEKALITFIWVLGYLNTHCVEKKVNAEHKYTPATPENLKILSDILDQTKYENHDLQPLILDYLIEYKLCEAFECQSIFPSRMCTLPNGNLAFCVDVTIQIRDIHNKFIKSINTLDWPTQICALNDSTIIAGENDIRIWDMQTEKCLKIFYGYPISNGHKDNICSLYVLPNNQFASASYDKTIKIWDINSGNCIQTLKGHKKPATSFSLLQNGLLASASVNDTSVRIWDLYSGECLQEIPEAGCVLCSLPNGRIASAFKNVIKIWDINFQECLQTLEGNLESITTLCVLTNDLLISGASDGTVKIWDINSRNCLQTLKAHPTCVISLFALPDCKFISVGYKDESSIFDSSYISKHRIIKIWQPTF